MSKFNFKKLATTALTSIAIAGGMSVYLGNNLAIAASDSNGVFGLELSYRDSAVQCGKNGSKITVKVQVFDQNNNLLATLSKGDKYMSNDVDSVNDLRFKYDLTNTGCAGMYSARDSKVLGSTDSLPNIAGFAGQTSVEKMLTDLTTYEELFLVELGTSDKNSAAYDLQDVIFVVDNNPALPD